MLSMRFFLLALFPLSLALSTSAETPASAQPAVAVTTHLVQVGVVVHGRKDEPVLDLTKDDFEIRDSGAPQPIAAISLETTLRAPTEPLRALPVNTFTNQPELAPTHPQAVTAILLDGLNTKFEDQAAARRHLIQFLKELSPDNHVALFTLGTDLRLLYDFTNDAGPLLRRLNGTMPRISTELADSEFEDSDTGNTDFDNFLNDSDQRLADFGTINRVQTTLAAIEAIAEHAARIPGRKNLIWISGGFPLSIGLDGFSASTTQQRRTFGDELERTARAVNAANMAIYPVDAHGVMVDARFSAASHGSTRAGAPPRPSKSLSNLQNTQSAMHAIADRTGGRAYMNTNDLKSAIRRAIDDSQVTYVLSFYPSHQTWDGSWHPLKVTCARRGVELHYRTGYFAFADKPPAVEDRQAAIREAAWSPLNESTLGITVRLSPHSPNPDMLHVVMRIALQDVQMRRNNGLYEGALDIAYFRQRGPDEAPTITDNSVRIALTQAQYDSYLKQGLFVLNDLNLAESAYRLKVIVRDAANGNTGSINIRTDKLKPTPPEAVPAPLPAAQKDSGGKVTGVPHE
jgi:VWFA-related protein